MFKKISEFLQREVIRRTFHYYFMFIYLGLSVGISGPTLPALADQTGSRLGQMGYLFLMASVGYTLGTLLGGRLLDRIPGHPVVGAGQAIGAMLIFFIPVVPWFWLLLLLVLVKGIAEGLVNGVNTMLIWTHKEKAGPYMNALHFFFGLGAFLAPFMVAKLILIPAGYRWAYWGVGTYGLLLGLRVLFLPGSPKPVHSHTDESGAPAPVYYPMVIAATLYLFFYVGAEITYGGWIFTYSTALNIFSAAGAAYLTSGFWFSFTVGRLLSIPVATRFSPRKVIPVALLGGLSALALVIILPASTTLLWVATALVGFCMAPLWPMGFTLAGQSIKLTARISSIILLGDSVGGMFLPWLVGQVIDMSGPRAMIALVLTSLAFNLLAFIVLIQLARHKTVTALV